jgi:hypothetical protein
VHADSIDGPVSPDEVIRKTEMQLLELIPKIERDYPEAAQTAYWIIAKAREEFL